MSYNCQEPNVIYYNISETSISCNSQSASTEYTKLNLQFKEIGYLGLQKIETDEESKLTFIDEDIYYIPLNNKFTKSMNKIFLNKNEMYFELTQSNELVYHKITHKTVYTLMINPYNNEYPIKNIVEFTSLSGKIPYNLGSVVVPYQTKYDIKLIIKKGNEIIYDENVNIELNHNYELSLSISLTKKVENLYIRVINLTNMINIQTNQICLS